MALVVLPVDWWKLTSRLSLMTSPQGWCMEHRGQMSALLTPGGLDKMDDSSQKTFSNANILMKLIVLLLKSYWRFFFLRVQLAINNCWFMQRIHNTCNNKMETETHEGLYITITWYQIDIIWCCQATHHYLSQCCPISMSAYGITKPQYVNEDQWCIIVSTNIQVCKYRLRPLMAFILCMSTSDHVALWGLQLLEL